jgi:hypothetical protein
MISRISSLVPPLMVVTTLLRNSCSTRPLGVRLAGERPLGPEQVHEHAVLAELG